MEALQNSLMRKLRWKILHGLDIQDKGYFIVGLDDAFPPMGFREEGTNDIIGFDIDLAKEAAKRLGVDVQFQPVVWDTVIEELNNGNIDVIWNGLTITEERKQKNSFYRSLC